MSSEDSERMRSTSSNTNYSKTNYSSRKPQRMSITVPWGLYKHMLEVSDKEGRSLSSLASHWLERQADMHRDQAE
jgi:hypothetical protein